MKNIRNRGAVLLVCLIILFFNGCGGGGGGEGGGSGGDNGENDTNEVTFIPQRIDIVLTNPGMGFADFHFGWWCNLPPVSFTPGDCAKRVRDHWPENYPRAGTAYFRWTWKELEPIRGQIDFHMIDTAIQNAYKRLIDDYIEAFPDKPKVMLGLGSDDYPWERDTFSIDLPAGAYQLEVGLLDKAGIDPVTAPLAPLYLGIAGRGTDGFYSIDNIAIP